MDLKKIGTVLVFCLIFAGVATAFGIAISPGNDPTNNPSKNVSIDLTVEEQTIIEGVEDFNFVGKVYDDLVIKDFKDYSTGTMYFELYKTGLFNGARTKRIDLFKCEQFDEDNALCIVVVEKTVQELNLEKKEAVEELFDKVLEAIDKRQNKEIIETNKGIVTVK